MGKTTGSGKEISTGIVRNCRSGGLVLVPKLEDVAMWKHTFRSCGRERDLIVFGSLTDKWRFNFLNFLQSNGGTARDITRFIRTLNDSLAGGSGGSHGEDGKFFEQQEDRLIYNAVEAVRQGVGAVTAPDLQKFITSAAYSPQQIASEEWQKGFHNQCLKAAFNRKKNRIESHDFELLQDYCLSEFPQMADKTRSSILAGVLGGLHVFNTGIVRELVSTTTNVTPKDEFGGKWILVNTPPAVYGDSGKLVSVGWKHLTQWANLRRPTGPDSYLNIIWIDECQQFLNGREDSHYLAQCRGHLGAMVCLTQSIHSVLGTFKGEGGRHDAHALLANFHHKVFHPLGDTETAEWAASLVGKSLQTFVGGSSQDHGDMFDALCGDTSYTGNFSEHYEQILQNNAFTSGLRTGGPENQFLTDAIVIRSGMPFSNGQSFLRCTFNQKG